MSTHYDRRTGMGLRLTGLLAAALTLWLTGVAHGANSDSHTVTVEVRPVSALQLSGGDVTLVVVASPGKPGQAENSSCQLSWATNEAGQKITVASTLASPSYPLQVEALNVAGGRGVGPQPVTSAPADLVVDVSHTLGRCDLRYSVTVPANESPGSEVHTVTYTILGTQ